MTLLLLPFALLSTIKNCFGLNWSPIGDIYTRRTNDFIHRLSLKLQEVVRCGQQHPFPVIKVGRAGLREVISSITRGKKNSYLNVLGLLDGILVYRPKANLPTIFFFDQKIPKNPKSMT